MFYSESVLIICITFLTLFNSIILLKLDFDDQIDLDKAFNIKKRRK